MAVTMKQLRAELAEILARRQAVKDSDVNLPPELLNIVGSYETGAEEFWGQKCTEYFPNATNPEDESFEVFFQKELVLLLKKLAQNGGALEYASAALKNNLEVVKIAVARHGSALEYASAALKNNPEVVKIAVAQYGFALKYASDALKNNPEVVKIAVPQYEGAIFYAGDKAKNNPAVMQAANLKYAGFEYSSTPDFNASFLLQVVASSIFAGAVALIIGLAVSLAIGVTIAVAASAGIVAGAFFVGRKLHTRQAFQEAEKDNLDETPSAEIQAANFGT